MRYQKKKKYLGTFEGSLKSCSTLPDMSGKVEQLFNSYKKWETWENVKGLIIPIPYVLCMDITFI